MDRLDPTEIDRSGWGERINLQVDMPGLFCTHQGIQYEIDKIIGRDYLNSSRRRIEILKISVLGCP